MKSSIKLSRVTENQLTKLYYSIGEVAKMFDVNTSLIRFWEKEFSKISPKKNKKGNRMFTPKDILLIDQIYSLVKEQGFTLEGAKNALKNGGSEPTDNTNSVENSQVIKRLELIRSKLINMKNQ